MAYIWSIPNNYPEKLVGMYDRDKSPDRFMFREGSEVVSSLNPIIINFSCKLEELMKYDCLVNSSQLPLINSRLEKILNENCESDVQFIDAVIKCSDGNSQEYKILNITNLVTATDHERSDCILISGTSAIRGFNNLVLKSNCLGEHEIARDKEYKSHILVSNKLRDCLNGNRITGVNLITVEEFNRL